jgi:hypothetical protein
MAWGSEAKAQPALRFNMAIPFGPTETIDIRSDVSTDKIEMQFREAMPSQHKR